ncbi:Solute carrier family 15 member 1 [Liparis tanakae]|uniref:Solute carrier family 15 member 1 n=1 Tax=Liparis tanakae TaxID=230148 RepID=A0A4Z2FR33_9TELE|nr:Solute carrier family 15 member 1 [Liparis tanakae]
MNIFYRTIIYLSIVYAVGQVTMAVSAVHDITDTNQDGTPDDMTFHVVLSMVGLLLIALGTGGIKPCVAAFGGDQFGEHQEKQRRTFFSVFYLCINGGSLLSTIITPILRAQECGIYTKQKCYSLAFGVPAALMVVALVVFIVGSGMYYKAEPQGNIMHDVSRCIGFAIKNRFRHRSSQYPKRKHWMDWAEEKYAGSRWTLQATTMDGNFGLLVIQPDQMQASEEFFTFDTEIISILIGSPEVVKNISLAKEKRQTLLMTSNINADWMLTNDLTAKPQEGNNAVRSVFSIRSGSESCEYSRDFGFGSSYTFFIPSTLVIGPNCQDSITVTEDIKPNSVHMALQIPQYFFITVGEVMFSVTGLEFSYSQAPSNMKAVLQAGWLLTVAVGNFIVLIVAELAKLPKQWAEYVLFASLLVVVCFIFSIMAHFYTYMDPAEIEAQFTKKVDEDDEEDKHQLQKEQLEMVKKHSTDEDEDDTAKRTRMKSTDNMKDVFVPVSHDSGTVDQHNQYPCHMG